jgi:hypothetical protein
MLHSSYNYLTIINIEVAALKCNNTFKKFKARFIIKIIDVTFTMK